MTTKFFLRSFFYQLLVYENVIWETTNANKAINKINGISLTHLKQAIDIFSKSFPQMIMRWLMAHLKLDYR